MAAAAEVPDRGLAAAANWDGAVEIQGSEEVTDGASAAEVVAAVAGSGSSAVEGWGSAAAASLHLVVVADWGLTAEAAGWALAAEVTLGAVG